jgi:tRNA pseudouridine38-40 synthase
MRLKLTIEYAGTRCSGWQIQKNARTVQGEIDRAIRGVTGVRPTELYGAGRTDAGVHALAQVAHLDLDTPLAPDALCRRLNDALPADINILRIQKVPRRFHARHHAVARSYLYQVSRRRTAFAKPYVWWVKDPLDVDRMRDAARRLRGFHDFGAFADADPSEVSTDVLIETLAVHEDGDLLVVHVEGSHFLWKMVRRLVGVLVEVGCGGLGPAEAASLLGSASPLPARLTAPASGLFLERVYYEGDSRRGPLLTAVGVRRV